MKKVKQQNGGISDGFLVPLGALMVENEWYAQSRVDEVSKYKKKTIPDGNIMIRGTPTCRHVDE